MDLEKVCLLPRQRPLLGEAPAAEPKKRKILLVLHSGRAVTSPALLRGFMAESGT